jgi:hypothetical protein
MKNSLRNASCRFPYTNHKFTHGYGAFTSALSSLLGAQWKQLGVSLKTETFNGIGIHETVHSLSKDTIPTKCPNTTPRRNTWDVKLQLNTFLTSALDWRDTKGFALLYPSVAIEQDY